MENKAVQKQVTAVSLLNREDVKKKFAEILGNKSQGFLTSVLSAVNANANLKKATPESVYMAAMMAAALDLPINPNLGFAYIIPYGDVAQFQMGYKGFIQLAQRSGQYKTIAASPVYEGQLISQDPLKGFDFDWTNKKSDKVIGYASYFSLMNGFEKTFYMTVEELQAHGKAYSKTYSSNSSRWKTDFHAMAMKTVIKLLISKYGPLSVDTMMQQAVTADQAVINNAETMDVTHVDVVESEAEVKEDKAASKESERLIKLLRNCKTTEELDKLRSQCKSNEELDVLLEMDEKLSKTEAA